MPRYKVKDGAVMHDGKLYGEGEEIELSDDQAASLRVEPVDADRRLNVKEAVALVEDCATIAEVEALLQGEGRKTVLDAAEKKKAALKKGIEDAAASASAGNDGGKVE